MNIINSCVDVRRRASRRVVASTHASTYAVRKRLKTILFGNYGDKVYQQAPGMELRYARHIQMIVHNCE